MATTDIPITIIKHQGHTITPITSDATLVDDTVAKVDSITALVGGPTTSVDIAQSQIKSYIPKVSIKRSR